MENPIGSYNTQQTVLLQSYLSNHKILVYGIVLLSAAMCQYIYTIDSYIDR